MHLWAEKKGGMNIEIWSVGKENESFIDEGLQYYFQKTRPYCPVELIVLQIPKKNATTDPERGKLAEEELILKRLQPQHYLILLDERGKKLNSIQWSQQFQQCMNQGVKTLVLLIGGAYGVTDNIRKKSNQCWSLSDLVFPHQLVRLILAEQVYRSFSILNNSPYHHA
jgi:23S rRNA (pseudouridine1915-N3)-methyltransferase